MGPKVSSDNNSAYSQLLSQFEVVRNKTADILVLRKKGDSQQYLLRQFTYNDKKQFQIHLQLLNRRKAQYSGCKHVSQLEKIFSQTQDQYCSTFYKIYALFQWNNRSLDDEINERNLQKKRFQENELWSIAQSCIFALQHLQKQTIKHQSLSSQSILFLNDRTLKVYDPLVSFSQNNYQTLLNKRSTSHLYLSPEQTQCLQRQQNPAHYHPYKSDVWTLGMILMEAGLSQYQDECYRDQFSRIHWETLQFNINSFKQIYSQPLGLMVQSMLQRQEKARPDWSQLSERFYKQQSRLRPQERMSNVSAFSHSNKDKIYQQISYKEPFKENMPLFVPAGSQISNNTNPLHTSNAHPIRFINQNQLPTNNNPQPVVLSFINKTRPNKSLFPIPIYNTHTIIDENLIAIHSESQQIEVTSSNKNHSFYFDSIPKPKIQEMNEIIFNNPFTTTKTNENQEQNKSIQTNMFSPFVNKTSSNPPPNSSDPKVQGEVITQRYKQGSQYTGNKLNGMRHGYGTFEYQDGGMYKGEWRYNKMQGNGSLFYQSGKLAYEGQWQNDQFSGRGTLYNETPQLLSEPFDFSDFDLIEEMWTKYEGQFREDLKSGHGILFLSNSEYFEGHFQDDYIDGEGTFTCLDGRQITNTWVQNKLIN